MTYKLNPELRLITSPVILLFPSGEQKQYENGVKVTEAVFDLNYRIVEVQAAESIIKITLGEKTVPEVNSIGDETFF